MIQEEFLTTRYSSFVSVPVLRVVVFSSCYDSVMSVAESLPVVLIPEQDAVAAMRYDMVNVSCLDVSPRLHALNTQRMCFKVSFSSFVPCAAVTTAACGACILRVKCFVLLTVFRAIRYERCTAGMLAWCVRSAWHGQHLLFSVLCKGLYYIPFQGGVLQPPKQKFFNFFTAPTKALVFRSFRKRIPCCSPHPADRGFQ